MKSQGKVMRSLRKFLPCYLIVSATAALCPLLAAEPGTDQGNRKDELPVLSPLEIRDWFALGSGCKGKDGGIGDVRMAVRQNPLNPMIYHIDFHMGSYRLDGSMPVAKKPTFARECSLRVAAYPGKNLKIANLSLDAEISVHKDAGAGLTLLSRTMTVQGNLSEWSHVHKKSETLAGKLHKVYLSPDAGGREILKNIPCEKPKVLGADFQILNERDSFSPGVLVRPEGKNRFSLTVTLANCTPVPESSVTMPEHSV